ncbi:hypothetical protein ACFYXS_19170 [Streptomyces sp. NPDC002574]|uniref:hypothetical protein n=1 Tax=Streptomyces sp. NPDC002574 TaxID=3364652 RepID=UPI0036940794
MRTAADERWSEAERAVRLLLRDTVPQPATPADRLVRIALRVRRRARRRRAAFGTAAALTAVVALAVVLPGLRSPQNGTDRAATPAAAPSYAASPTPTPSPTVSATVDAGLTALHLPGLGGLTLRVPRGWHALEVADRQGNVVGYVSSQPLTAPAHALCTGSPDELFVTCRPLTSLHVGGVLMAFRSDATGKATDAVPLAMGGATTAGKGCRTLLGSVGTIGWGHGRTAPSGKPFELQISVCLRGPADGTLAMVTKALETAFPRTGG